VRLVRLDHQVLLVLPERQERLVPLGLPERRVLPDRKALPVPPGRRERLA
jgi:hypothetical protein